MNKTDKELAVELVGAYLSAWFANSKVQKPLDGETLKALLKDAYSALADLPKGT